MKISSKLAARIVSGVGLFLLLAGCSSQFNAAHDDPTAGGPRVWVSDNKMSTWRVDDSTSQVINFAPNATSLAYWQAGVDPYFGQDPTACPPSTDDCGKLFYVSGGKLFVVDTPAGGSTPVPRPVATQFTPGRVAWSGEGGRYLYVTYPNNAAVGRIEPITETEDVAGLIHLPGTSPQYITLGYPEDPQFYTISGSPGNAQQLVAFGDKGPISGVPTPSLSFATAISANLKFVAVIASGKLLVYSTLGGSGYYASGLSAWGTLSSGPPGWNPNNVVVDPNSNMAYVTSLSGPNTPGQVNAVNLETMSIVGPTVTIGTGPFNMVLSWDGSRLFVANQNDGPPGTVSVLSASTGGASLLHTIKVGTKPGALTIHP